MRKCKICGKEFHERTSRQVYCSPKCNAAAHRRSDLARKRTQRSSKARTIVCKGCGKPFESPHQNVLYCSTACRLEAKRERMKQYRTGDQQPPTIYEFECDMCGKKFTATVPTARFCPACRSGRGRAKVKTPTEPERPPKDYDRMNAKIREAMERHVSYGQLQVIAAREAAKEVRERSIPK